MIDFNMSFICCNICHQDNIIKNTQNIQNTLAPCVYGVSQRVINSLPSYITSITMGICAKCELVEYINPSIVLKQAANFKHLTRLVIHRCDVGVMADIIRTCPIDTLECKSLLNYLECDIVCKEIAKKKKFKLDILIDDVVQDRFSYWLSFCIVNIIEWFSLSHPLLNDIHPKLIDALSKSKTIKYLRCDSNSISQYNSINTIIQNSSFETIDIQYLPHSTKKFTSVVMSSRIKNIELKIAFLTLILSLSECRTLTNIKVYYYQNDCPDPYTAIHQHLEHNTWLLNLDIETIDYETNYVIQKYIKRNNLLKIDVMLSTLLDFTLIFYSYPPYIILELFDWYHVHTHPYVHYHQKISLIYNVMASIKKFREIRY